MVEIWTDIKGYEGYYQISNLGNVKSLDRIVEYRDGRHYIYKSRMLTKTVNTHGYYCVRLTQNSISKPFDIHILVAKHFVRGYFDGSVVNHKDKNPKNNYYKNLEWVTQRRNVQHGYDWPLDLEKHIKDNLYSDYVLQGLTTIQIAKIHNISDTTIRRYLKELNIKIRDGNKKQEKPIGAYDIITNKFISKFNSQHECARKLNIEVRNLNSVLKGRRKSCQGYYFKYLQEVK